MLFITPKIRFTAIFILGLILLPSNHFLHAQIAPTNEVPPQFYNISNNQITFDITWNDYCELNVPFPQYFVGFMILPTNEQLGDTTGACILGGNTYGLGSTTIESSLGLGSAIGGTRFEYRFSTGYLGTPIKKITIAKSNGVYSPYYQEFNTAPTNYFINHLTPEYGTTTATNTVNISVAYFFDTFFATTTKAEFSIYDAITGVLENNIFQIIPAGFDVNFTINQNFILATGSKKVIGRLVVASTDQDIIAPTENFFSVITNTYFLYSGLETPLSNPADLSQIDCNTFDLGCQFQKAMVFVFVPSQSVLNKFSTLWQELKFLKPFGYVSVIFEQIKSISATGVGAYTMPTIPFMDTIFTPLKTVMSVMLWGIFAFVFYNKRLKNLDI